MQAIGNYLREVREKRGLSQTAVEEGCKIPIRYIQAIESGDFSLLPGRAYTIGFIRTYAKFLQVDSDELVEYYKENYPAEEPVPYAPEYQEIPMDVDYGGQPLHFNNDSAAPAQRFNPKLLILIAVIAVVIVVVVLFANGVLGGQTAPDPNQNNGGAPVVDNSGSGTEDPDEQPAAAPLTVLISATKGDCDLVVTTDGAAETMPVSLVQGQQISFAAETSLSVEYSNAGAVDVTVNGQEWAVPGEEGTSASVEYNINQLTQ